LGIKDHQHHFTLWSFFR